MNYSKHISKKAIGRRVLISWIIIAIAFLLSGLFLGWGFTAIHYNHTEQAKLNEIEKYGTVDGMIFQAEVPLNWKAGSTDFVPLDVPMDRDLQEFIYYLCEEYNIEFTFVMALIRQESAFDSSCTSVTGDFGLMQINQCNFDYINQTLGINNVTNPYDNVRAGVFILRKLFEKYQKPNLVLMAYNMGESGAARLWENGIFESNYSKAVQNYQMDFEQELKGVNND